jgi:hypothetical protein
MERPMKHLVLCITTCSLLFTTALVSAEPAKDQAVAAAYFEALIGGDEAKANELIAVPFSLDRKSILKTKEEVEAVHKQIAKEKGKRPVPKYTIAKTEKAPKLDAAIFPKYVAFRVLMEDDEWIDIYVSGGDAPKVLGSSD